MDCYNAMSFPLISGPPLIIIMAVYTQPKIAGGQSEVQKVTLLLLMIWHQKKGTCSQKGHFFPRLPHTFFRTELCCTNGQVR